MRLALRLARRHKRVLFVCVLQDALLAMSESAKAFILYLTATAATHQASARRQTLLEADVYAALRDIQFGELVQPLKNEVAGER